jgi:hypothetical protein
MICPIENCDGQVYAKYEAVDVDIAIENVQDGQYHTAEILGVDFSKCMEVNCYCTNDHLLTLAELEPDYV